MSKNNSSPEVRYLGFLKQPCMDTDPLELDESEINWSSDSVEVDSPNKNPGLPSAFSKISLGEQRSFRTQTFGLSAVLSNDHHSILQRKSNPKPSFSPTSPARAVPPVPTPRSKNYLVESHHSAPVNIPTWPKRKGAASDNLGLFDENDDEIGDKFIPPHEFAARSHVSTLSVFEGAGRTLKGRDLRRVRNAIWRKTGFLD